MVKKILRSLKSSKADVTAAMIKTLRNLCDNETQVAEDKDFEEFVMRCMHEVNRGGLKILKNEAFDFFKLVEISVYYHITQSSSTGQVNPDPESIVQHLLQDVDLQFLWCMLTVDLEESASNELLSSIVRVWIKVRTFICCCFSGEVQVGHFNTNQKG